MDRRCKLAFVIAFGTALPLLAACTPDAPDTQLSWDANEHVGHAAAADEPPAYHPDYHPAYRSAPAPQRQARTYIYQGDGEALAKNVPEPRPRPQYAPPQRQEAAVYDRDYGRDYRQDYGKDDYGHADRGSVAFAWPADGRVISNFGTTLNGERNDGINIAMPMGAPIHAAASGTVSYSGNELKDYGNLLLIKHPGGYVTAYAHVDQLLVRSGEAVVKGQVIGYAGQTGDVSSPQLHFEIRHNTTPLNPDSLLASHNS